MASALARYKLIFYTPAPPAEKIKTALFAAGAGTHASSKYSHCAFQTLGTGQFKPLSEKGANPHIGTADELEKVEELRIEVLCEGEETAKKAVEALKR